MTMATKSTAPQADLVNIDAERAVLGSILIDPAVMLNLAPVLAPRDFWRDGHIAIYTAMVRLYQNQVQIDFLTLIDFLNTHNHLEKVGGPAYITGLIDDVPTSIHAQHYADIVTGLAKRRQLIDLAGRIAQLAYDKAQDLDTVLGQIDTTYYEATARVSTVDTISAKDLMADLYDEVETAMQRQGLMGITTGFEEVDDLLGGMHGGDMILVAARPSVGKTATLLNVALAAAKSGKRTLFLSLEMSAIQLAQRLACIEAGLDTKRVRRGQFEDGEFLRLMDAMAAIGQLPLDIIWTGSQDPLSLRATARKHKAEKGLDLLCIDYLQLMTVARSAGRNRREQVDEISRSLKLLAKDLNVPVVANAQLSRGVETRTDKRPMLSDLRESGALEQDSDIVVFLYRHELYAPEEPGVQGRMEFIVSKHRNGPTGTVFLHMRPWCNQVVSTRLDRSDDTGLQIRMPIDEWED